MRVWAQQIGGPVLSALALLSLGWAGGCTRRTEVVLHQPAAPPAQRELKLASAWTYSGPGSDRRSYLLAFPLPGAKDGPRDFFVYLSAPAGRGRFVVDADGPEGIRGFLIQAVGDLRGKATFVGGEVRISPVWLASRRTRLDLNVRCDDGTAITGRAEVESAADELRSFERRYAADIALLAPAGSPPPAASDRAAAHATGVP